MLETVTGRETLGRIHHALDHAWQRHRHVPVSIRMDVATAAAEIGANIVRHTGRHRTVTVRMEIEVRRHQVIVVFTDDGGPAAVDLDAVGMPHERAHQGRGLALAVAVLDGLFYQRDVSCNRWTLVSRRFGGNQPSTGLPN